MRVQVRQHPFDRAFQKLAIVYFFNVGGLDAAEDLGKLAQVVQRKRFFRVGPFDVDGFISLDAFQQVSGICFGFLANCQTGKQAQAGGKGE